jgi:transcriptional regulator with XRE-family HTH domain
MNLKDKIIQVLKSKNLSYSDLANYIGVTEENLNKSLETRTLEIRTLELISKELRIPLYSFFRNEEAMKKHLSDQNKVFYETNIWSDQELILKNDLNVLSDKIIELQKELAQKNELILNLEKQLKGNH